jgi:hydrogenase expression/formation protein HypE
MPETILEAASFVCPAPLVNRERVVLGHGSGGRLSAELLRDVFLPLFSNPVLDRLDDQAIFEIGGRRVAFTTDSFVVKPLFFPGGDIGSLAVHGTVNDLAMGGAIPLFLSVGFILEEGLPMDTLRAVTQSMASAAAAAGVAIVTGDTKVVEKGKGDGLYINTTGIGMVREGVRVSANQARPGDRVILSGTIGDHGIAILACREGLELETGIESDSAALHELVGAMLNVDPSAIRCLRDPTRGGLSSALNEIANCWGSIPCMWRMKGS